MSSIIIKLLGNDICKIELVSALASEKLSDLVKRVLFPLNLTALKIYIGDQECNFEQPYSSMFEVPEPEVTLAAIMELGLPVKKILVEIDDKPIVLHSKSTQKLPPKQVVIHPMFTQEVPPKVNAFYKLMNAGQEVIQLTKTFPRTGRDEITNHLIDYLQEANVNFTNRFKNDKTTFFKNLSQAIWTLDCHLHKFDEINGAVHPPAVFFPKQFRKLDNKGANKRKPPKLTCSNLKTCAESLEVVLNQKTLQLTEWSKVRADIENLKASLDCYCDYLEQNSTTVTENSLA